MSRDTILGLDIGTCNTRVVIAQENEQSKKLQILGFGLASSSGLRRGVVIDIEETVKSIKESLEMAEKMANYPVDCVYSCINGEHIKCRPNKGVVAVSRADGEISSEDVERVIDMASKVSLPQNKEILHILPRHFIVDEQDFIRDPVGMSGTKLEVDALLIDASKSFIKNLNKCIKLGGIENDSLISAPLAASQAVLSKQQKELGVLNLDMGGGTTGLTVIEEGDIIYSQVLPIGGLHVTNDIALGLRTSIDLAEKIKIKYGSVLTNEIDKKEIIDLSKLDEDGEGIVRRYDVAEIIEARISEILDLVNKELKKIDRQGLLPAGVVLTGQGAKMPGLVDLVKQKLRLPAQIGFPIDLEGIVDQVDDPSFATAIGLVRWGLNQQERGPRRIFDNLVGNSAEKAFNKVKKWFRGFLP